jgi:F-type H+-transporting ATPase subunit b
MLDILAKIGFDWQVALANFINFIIIFFLLRKFAFKPISKVIKERQDKIAEGLLNAEKAKTELMMAEETGKNQINQAKIQANEIIIEAQNNANLILSSSQEEALITKSGIIKEGQKQIEEKKVSMIKELEKETAYLIVDSLEKILRENLTKDQQENYIKKILVN